MADITSIVINFNNGVSATVLVSPTATTVDTPLGRVNLAQAAPKAPTGLEIATNPGVYDGDPQDPTMAWAPTWWEGSPVPPAPPKNTMADLYRINPDLARAVWRHNLGVTLDEDRLSPAQRKRCGL